MGSVMPKAKKEIDYQGLYTQFFEACTKCAAGDKDLDQVVAEFFGYRLTTQGKWKAPHKDFPTRPAIPHFTTDTDTALLLFKLFLKDYEVRIHEDFDPNSSRPVLVKVVHWSIPRHQANPGALGVYEVQGRTRQLALCMAAMKAWRNHERLMQKVAA